MCLGAGGAAGYPRMGQRTDPRMGMHGGACLCVQPVGGQAKARLWHCAWCELFNIQAVSDGYREWGEAQKCRMPRHCTATRSAGHQAGAARRTALRRGARARCCGCHVPAAREARAARAGAAAGAPAGVGRVAERFGGLLRQRRGRGKSPPRRIVSAPARRPLCGAGYPAHHLPTPQGWHRAGASSQKNPGAHTQLRWSTG